MIFDFIWLSKCSSFINSILLPEMFPVQFHDIEYEVVSWRLTELMDRGGCHCVTTEMSRPPHSRGVGVLQLVHIQFGSYSAQQKK